MKNIPFPVLNAGEVKLLETLGSDLDVVNAAKVSFASYETEMNDKSKGLINYLIKNHHATPFEHVVLKFYVKCPIFVAREWFRHRWSSFNEMSMRYHVPQNLDFWQPKREELRTQVGKPGAYSFQPFEDDLKAEFALDIMNSMYTSCYEVYKQLIDMGIAKEVARAIIPVGQYTEFIWTVNLRSLMNFLSLRNHKDAQFEIAEYARVIETIIADFTPEIYNSWVNNGREAI